MLGLTTIFNTLKCFISILILVELVVIYCAITEEFVDLVLNCINYKLSLWGYLFSIEGPIRIISRYFVPVLLIFLYCNRGFSKRENLLKTIWNIFHRFTLLQLFVSFFLLLIFWYYLHNFYSFLYHKYKHCKL